MAEDRQAKRLTIPYAKFGKQIQYCIDAVKAYLLSLGQAPQSAPAVDESVEFLQIELLLERAATVRTEVQILLGTLPLSNDVTDSR